MFENIYSRLIRRVNYKTLIFIPLAASVLMLLVILVNPVPLGMDFKGGTLIEVAVRSGAAPDLSVLENELKGKGLEDLKIYKGDDIETRESKVRISTTNILQLSDISDVLAKDFGELRETDQASLTLDAPPPSDLKEKLLTRMKQRIDVNYDNSSKVLKLEALEMDKSEIESALGFYLGRSVSVDYAERNVNIAAVQPSLGERLRTEGFNAAIYGYVLMAFIVILAFRNFVPAVAVLLSATCDAVITLGMMSLFGIVLEPASLVALIMLVGYSVDTDIMLTSRIMRKRKGEIDEAVDGALQTGLTMTGTTFVVMLVVFIVSTVFTHVSTLASISSVLVLGLMADVASTWFMNAGILKWYIEERGGRFTK
jgi:preprotein translocase subunit SecF